METMHASGRRNLPPVPPPATDVTPGEPTDESPAERTMELRRRAPEETPTAFASDDAALDDTALGDTAPDDTAVLDRPADAADLPVEPGPAADLDAALFAAADEPEHALADDDPAQRFVWQLRAAADDFAAAAGAATAVVREAVPPARHRRSRCRVVLRYADGDEADLTFLGAVGRPGTPAWQNFDLQIRRWLGNGQQRQAAWLVEDTEAPDGLAVDVPAWLAAG